jgi:hypothetical protein
MLNKLVHDWERNIILKVILFVMRKETEGVTKKIGE